MVQHLLTTDFTTATYCEDFSLTDVIMFPNPAPAKDLEEKLCRLDPQELVQELMETPYMKRYSDKVCLTMLALIYTHCRC